MKAPRLLLVCLLLLLPAAALAQSPFSGTFLGEGNERLVLKQQGAQVSGQVLVGGMQGQLSGKVDGQQLRGKVVLPWGDSAPFTATLKGGDLHFQLEGDPTIGVYRRQGGAAPAPASAPTVRTGAATPSAAPAPAPSAGSGPALSAKGPKAGGQAYRHEYQGWGLKLPPGWNGKEQDGMLVLGHASEAGMIVVQATEERDPEALRQGLASDLLEVGLRGEVPAFQTGKLPAGRSLVVELPVVSNDGANLKVRAAGVSGPRGTVAIIGTTSPEHFASLRKRVDAMARSVTFFQPKVAPGARILAGEWYSFTSVGAFTGGGGGTEASLALCPDGTFADSSQSSYWGGGSVGGDFSVVGAPQSSRARWRSEGGAAAGKIFVTYPNGNTRVIPYQAKAGSDGYYFDGRLYGKTGGGKVCR
ncbi:MAG: hypothetical protein P1V51_04865 [Deltaproteobacteria bacterium]|nr:hypothetical protein [Deltaproteobacteria bacterium]